MSDLQILPLLSALSFMETTSDPAFGSLIASAPTVFPAISCNIKCQIQTWKHIKALSY